MSGLSAATKRAVERYRRMVEREAEREARERAERYAAGFITIDDLNTIPADPDDPDPVWVRIDDFGEIHFE
jgi:hypothetical protein